MLMLTPFRTGQTLSEKIAMRSGFMLLGGVYFESGG